MALTEEASQSDVAAAQRDNRELSEDLRRVEGKLQSIEDRIESRVSAHPSVRYEVSLRDEDESASIDLKLKASDIRAKVEANDGVVKAFRIADATEQRDIAIRRMEASADRLRVVGRQAVKALSRFMDLLGQLDEPSLFFHKSKMAFGTARQEILAASGTDGGSAAMPPCPVTSAELHQFVSSQLQTGAEYRDPKTYYSQFPGLAITDAELAEEEEEE